MNVENIFILTLKACNDHCMRNHLAAVVVCKHTTKQAVPQIIEQKGSRAKARYSKHMAD